MRLCSTAYCQLAELERSAERWVLGLGVRFDLEKLEHCILQFPDMPPDFRTSICQIAPAETNDCPRKKTKIHSLMACGNKLLCASELTME